MPSWKKIIVSGSNISQLTNDSGFAKTGSANTFYANQTINGDLVVTGSITALQYIVSSSVIYITESNFSGSNVFGNTMDDTHQFTGSVYITGSVNISGSINLSDGASINEVKTIDFYNDYIIGTNAPAWKEGRLFYDSGSGALAFYNWEQDVTLNIGQESWLRARNNTGTLITNGSVVKLTGAVGDRPSIALAQSTDQTNTFSTSNEIIGMATHDIENGTDGFVTTFGLVNGLDTSAYNAGDILWVSQSAGQFTKTPPPTPYDRTFVGIVARANPSNGSVFVTPLTPIHFHDISSVSASAYTMGDIWMYRSGSAGQANAWINTKNLIGAYTISGSLILTESLTANSISASSITGSLQGTASWASNASNAAAIDIYTISNPSDSYLLMSNVLGTTGVGIGGDTDLKYNSTTNILTVPNISATTLTGSLLGTASTASYYNGSITNSQLPAQINVTGVTASFNGSLFGTASWATEAVTASFAPNYVLNSSTSSFVLNSQTSSMTVLSASFSTTASYVNTLNQSVIISGSTLSIIPTTLAGTLTENVLIIGPASSSLEGGQLILQAPGGTYTSASMWDNYSNYTRLLRGSNNGSDAIVAQWNMHTKQMQLPAYNSLNAFSGTPVAALGVNSSGDIITIQTGSGAGTGGGSTFQAGTNIDNRIITATGTTPELNGEANLTFDGSRLTVTGEITASGAIRSTANNQMYFRGGDDAEFWDINVANTVGIYGQQTQGEAGLKLGSGGATLYGSGSRFGIGTTGPVATLDVNGNLYVAAGITGSLTGSVTGALIGTASWATNALTASYVTSSNVYGPYGLNSILSASYASQSLSSSYAFTSSYSVSSSYALSSSYAVSSSYSVSSSYATTASYALNSTTPGGSNTYIQFNSASAFNGSQYFRYIITSNSFQHGYGTTAAVGGYSHAEGENTTALGALSHAEGYSTTATGPYTHTEGVSTNAIGAYSHAEGQNTNAYGQSSHAEGQNTTVSSNSTAAHAEGYFTLASASYSHAEGANTQAKGESSHAEGYGSVTEPNALTAHAEGWFTTAAGIASHAEGRYTLASASYSHAEGTNLVVYQNPVIDITTITNVAFDFGTYSVVSCDGTDIVISGDITGDIPGGVPPDYTLTSLDVIVGAVTITVDFGYYGTPVITNAVYNVGTNETTLTFTGLSSIYQVVEIGSGPIASGYGSHAEGFSTIAYGAGSHAEGYNTQAIGKFSHADGTNTIASGAYSYAGGTATQAIGVASFAIGQSSKAYGEASFAHGSNAITIGLNSFALGDNTVAYGDRSFVHGGGTIASGSNQAVFGYYNTRNNTTDLFVIGNGTYNLDRKDIFNVSTTTITMSGSVNISGSLSLNGAPILPKGGSVNQASFGGTPLSASVTFTTAMPSTNYSIAMSGQDARIWSYSNKATTGFTINSNSSTALTAPVDWTATLYS